MAVETIRLVERDKKVIWHPYTQHKISKDPLPVVKAEGVYLIDENGNKYIDAISSWWTNIHGHCHPYIAKKISEQVKQLEHVVFAGCTHEPAVLLAERILALLPSNFSKVFYSDNGSTAVEVALKMGIQYWKVQGTRSNTQYPMSNVQYPNTNVLEPGTQQSATSNQLPVPVRKVFRNKILTLRHSYHGDTFGAMSISERSLFTLAFQDYLFDVIFIDPTTFNLLPSTFNFNEVACFIYEPLIQGAGGMKIYSPQHLNDLLKICRQYDIICIADEVMTGFGRTGKLFASEYINEKPDIICLSKGLTGGALPLSITACSEKIYNAFLSDDPGQTFFHGHSFTANPLACSAALASLDLLQQEECNRNIQYITAANFKFIQELKSSVLKKKLKEPRSIGTILAFELVFGPDNYLNEVKEIVTEIAIKHGVFLRPLGNTIYIMPPYCITPIQLEKIYHCLRAIIAEV